MAEENYGAAALDEFKTLYPADSEEALQNAFSLQQQDTWALRMYELAQLRATAGKAYLQLYP